ncbi:MAG: hypothetical protein C5B57_13320 [Blastocatellia bacterium]|nr:MAG: hypothetical protein C5B57_13320 [Blastocatellia bacterium]
MGETAILWETKMFEPRNRRLLKLMIAMALSTLSIGVARAGQEQVGARSAGRSGADEVEKQAEGAAIQSMSHHHMHDDPHMRLTKRRTERPGDRERAAAIVTALRPALEQYRDYHVAIENGYQIFLPNLPQPVYHFTNYLEGFAEAFRFKADQATSLLYRKTKGGYELVGAMYTAPRDATENDLDMRVPLSIAQWHAHVNICLPRQGTAPTADWTKFGPGGSISTADACAAAGGRFLPQLFGWMVHVYPFEQTMEKIWNME